MKKISKIRSAIYNKVVARPKSWLRKRCDMIPERDRLHVVLVLLGVFVAASFFIFGNACYHIGKGDRQKMESAGQINAVELQTPDSHGNN